MSVVVLCRVLEGGSEVSERSHAYDYCWQARREPIDEPTYHVLSVRFMHAEARPGGRSEGSYIPAGRILLPRAAITTGAYYAFALVAIGAGIWLERHPEN